MTNSPTITPPLQSYIEEHIFPEYALNDPGHQLGHINYVIHRSLKFAETIPDINYDMVYAVAAYHDIAHHIDHKNHEHLSAERLQNDQNLQQFFTAAQIQIMAEAVYDHRSTMTGDPRSIYGKIVSSADRNTSVSAALTRSYAYRVAHEPELSTDEKIEGCRRHLLDKFGPHGYARQKIYFPDPEYDQFLMDITQLASNPAEFARQSKLANHLL